MAGLGFGILGEGPKTIQTSDYRTAGSHQIENLNFLEVANANTWTEIVTIAADRTYYITGIVLSSGSATRIELGTGASASEVPFFTITKVADVIVTLILETPIKITGGTRISGKSDTAGSVFYNLIGWEE